MRLFHCLTLLVLAAFLGLALFPASMPFARAVEARWPDAAGLAESVGYGLRESWSWAEGVFSGCGLTAPRCPAALYLILINLLALAAMGLDKLLALLHGRRIPEKALFALCILGGALGGWTGMYLFHHKTSMARKPHFVFGFPAIFFLQAALGVLVWKRLL